VPGAKGLLAADTPTHCAPPGGGGRWQSVSAGIAQLVLPDKSHSTACAPRPPRRAHRDAGVPRWRRRGLSLGTKNRPALLAVGGCGANPGACACIWVA
jgi:hypothetical protein